MALHNKMNENKFKAIKILLNGGATYKEAAEFMQVSEGCVYRVKVAETWQEYLNANAARVLAQKEARQKQQSDKMPETVPEVKPETVPEPKVAEAPARQYVNPTVIKIEATHYMMQEMQKTNELLKQISAKLAFIVDELCGTAQK